MNFWMSVLRLVHIFGGFFWAGSGFLMAGFVVPASKLAGKEGQAFMQTLMGRTKYSMAMGISALLTILSGLTMYYLLFGFLAPLNTGPGLMLTVGGIAGLAAWVIGAAVHGRNGARLQAIGKAVAATGGAPSAEQLAEIEKIEEQNSIANVLSIALFVVAIAGMSLSEYFSL